MSTNYDLSLKRTTIPVTISIQQLNKKNLHRHKQLEIIFMLTGTINIRIQEDVYQLQVGDIILINPYDLHGLIATSEDNVFLCFKVGTEYYDYYASNFSTKRFLCNSTLSEKVAFDKNSPFEELWKRLAMLVFQQNDNQSVYGFSVGMIILDIGKILITNFQSESSENYVHSKDVQRLTRILDEIDNNFDKGINLKDIAEKENLNLCYLSSFIKQQLGIGFQEYVNMKRIEKVIDQLLTTNKTITEIAFSSGFSNTKSLNQLFKKIVYKTPTEFRIKYSESRELLPNFDIVLEGKEKDASDLYSMSLKVLEQYLD